MPTTRAESLVDETISRSIPLELYPPKLTVRRWIGRVLRTSVPEATVDKYRQTCPQKHKVRSPEERITPSPPADLVLSKHLHQADFGRRVSTPFDPRHDVRA